MTIVFLHQWQQHSQGAVVSLGSAEETRLIALGLAEDYSQTAVDARQQPSGELQRLTAAQFAAPATAPAGVPYLSPSGALVVRLEGETTWTTSLSGEDNRSNSEFDSLVQTPLFGAPFRASLAPSAGGATITYGRASVAWYPDAAGVYRLHAVNAPGFGPAGLRYEPPRRNYLTCHNASPDSALTGISVTGAATIALIDRTSDLDDAGLQDICPSGLVCRYVNTTGAQQTITIAAETFPAGVYRAAVSLWARSAGASVTLQLTGGGGARPIAPESKFARHVSQSIGPVAGTEDLQLVVPAGAVIEWVLAQCELGPVNSVNACTTSPIVTAGAGVNRAQVVANIALGAGSWPVSGNNLTLLLEVSLDNDQQDFNNPVVAEGNKDSQNRFVLNTQTCDFRVANVNTQLRHRFGPGSLYARVAMRVSPVSGVDIWVDGGKGQVGSPTSTAGTGIDTGTLFLGSRSYGDQYLCGQIAVKVYPRALSDSEMLSLTLPVDDTLLIQDIGPVLYDRNSTRIWALARDGGVNWTRIDYSDDHGRSWLPWCTLNNPTNLQGLAIDRRGNAYYATGSGLWRVDAVTKAQTLAITWFPVRPDWTWHPWTWGEDRAGNIYTSAYTLTGTGNQYIWKGTPGGLSWTRRDSLVTGASSPNRHVHSIHVSPFTDAVWVCYGDDAATRGTAFSTNGLATDVFATDWTVVTDPTQPGPTGISFSDEGAYLFTDVVGNNNFVKFIANGSSTAQSVIQVPVPYHTAPLYFGRLCGRNEVWFAPMNEAAVSSATSAVMMARKANGGTSPWRVQKIISLEDGQVTGLNYRHVSHNGDGIIPPDAPYVYASLTTMTGLVAGVLRIPR